MSDLRKLRIEECVTAYQNLLDAGSAMLSAINDLEDSLSCLLWVENPEQKELMDRYITALSTLSDWFSKPWDLNWEVLEFIHDLPIKSEE